MSFLRHLARVFGVEATLKDMEIALRMESILEKPPAMHGPMLRSLLEDHKISPEQQGRVLEEFFPDILEDIQQNPKNKNRGGLLQNVLDYHQRQRVSAGIRISGQSFNQPARGARPQAAGLFTAAPPPQKMEKSSGGFRESALPLPKNFSEDGATQFDFPKGFFDGTCDSGEFYGAIIRYMMSKDDYLSHHISSDEDLKLLNDLENSIAQALLRRPTGEIEREAATHKSGLSELLLKLSAKGKKET